MNQMPDDFSVSVFQSLLDEGKLLGVSCKSCEQVFVPPRPICTNCQQAQMAWKQLSGRATLAGFTSIYVVSSGMLKRGYGRDNPYLTGIVTLEEGPRIPARLVGMNPKHPENISIGTPLEATFLKEQEDESTKIVLAFKPATR
jgi:uncharacterized OB-fold protein